VSDAVVTDELGSPAPPSKHNVPRFTWRDRCDGWTLLSRPNLHILRERMPPDTFELLHLHEATVQFYYVLDGEATVRVNRHSLTIGREEGIAIPPGAEHQIRNDSRAELEFLVLSSQPPRHDRVDISEG
jgi:mannose-6-phosphate isomerase-like protein (cupin superfamily)